jgi:hypothetical protein
MFLYCICPEIFSWKYLNPGIGRDIQVGIFEPRDWVYFQALSSWARAETCQKLVQTSFFMVLNKGIPVLKKFRFKNLQKILFEENQVQDPIPVLPGHGSQIPALILGDIYSLAYILIFSSLGAEMWKNREQTDRRTISIEHFFF